VKAIKGVVGILCAAMFLYLAVEEIDAGLLQTAFSTINYGFVFLAVIVSLATYWIRAWRWRIILLPVKEVRLSTLFAATVIGFMANNILPLRIGEVGKALVLSIKEQLQVSAILATIVVERAFDGGAIAVLGLTLFFFPILPPWMQSATLGLFALCLLALLCLTFLVLYKKQVSIKVLHSRWAKQRLGLRFIELVTNFAAGAEALRDVRAVMTISALSFILWVAHMAIFYLTVLALGLELPAYTSLVVLVFTSIGVLLPSGPGYIGTFQYFTILALTIFSVPKEQALSYAVVAHASQWAPVTLLGLVYIWSMGLKLSDLFSRESKSKQNVPLQA
jgi:uncharacterized protein (TIRG00374 family)